MAADTCDLGRKIMEDKYNSIVFEAAGDLEVYIVGGFTRDILSLRSSIDRDYAVMGSTEPLVAEVVRATHGKLIELGREGLRRIVLNDGVTLDFTPVRENIEKDLSGRDFTINAIAWSPQAGWVDPNRGMDDLKRGLVRMIDAVNLKADPLRILRAYRFSAELSFAIESDTKSVLRRLASLIHNASGERITSEFFRILNLNNAGHTLEIILNDALLSCIIILPYKDLERKIKAFAKIYDQLLESFLRYGIRPGDIISQGLTARGLLGLEVLLEDLPQHLLVLSRRIARRLSSIHQAGRFLLGAGSGPFNRETLFELFEISGQSTPDFLLLHAMPDLADSFKEYLTIRKKGLLSAEEVSSSLGGISGLTLGRAIRSIRKAQFAGRITTAQQAKDFLRVS